MKIILMSGVGFESRVRDHGWDFIHKPFRVEALKRDIQHLLGDVLAGTQTGCAAHV
jgi:hypothetical protein